MLLRHAFGEPDWDLRFRRRCFEARLRDCPRLDAARDALSVAGRDPDPALQFHAARHLGAGGRSILRPLLRAGGLPDELCAEAVALLGHEGAGGLALAPEEGTAGSLSLDDRAGPGALGNDGLSPIFCE